MAKASKPGRTKTRLSVVVGGDEAARLNTAFLEDIAANLVGVCGSTSIAGHASIAGYPSIAGYMAFGPPGEERFFDFLPSGIALFVAWQPTFGETLKAAIRHLLASGHSAACVLNADSPTLPPAILVEAARWLAEPGDTIVLGPSNDGGYYLLGMKRMHEHLFEDIAWSTEHVTGQTLERARDIGLSVRLLPEWYDVDDAKSFEILRRELFEDRPFGASGLTPAPARSTRAALAELDAAVLRAVAR